jgi:hypothetical protein
VWLQTGGHFAAKCEQQGWTRAPIADAPLTNTMPRELMRRGYDRKITEKKPKKVLAVDMRV